MPLTEIKFTDGLDRDSSFLSGTALYDAQNITIFTDEGKSTGAIQVISGNTLVDIQNCTDASDAYDRTEYVAINVIPVRKDFIVLYAKVDNSGYGIIDKLVRVGDSFTRVQLYKSTNLSTNLGLQPNIPMTTEVNYLSPETIWLHFTNQDYPLRILNVGTKNNPALEASYSLQSEPAKIFNRLPQVEFGQISFDGFGVGNLRAGAYQYVYRVLTVNGSYSAFSPASRVIYVAPVNIGDWKTTKGADTAVDSTVGVSVRCSIDLSTIDLSYVTRLQVVQLYYSSESDTPTCSIIEQIDSIPNIVSFVDESNEAKYGTLTYTELTSMNYDLAIESLASKDNILFGLNVREITFDVAFDARAFRFNSSGVCKVINNGVEKTVVKTGTWPNATYTIDGLPIPEEADLINPTNTSDTDEYIYQSDGVTVGAEGQYVKIEIATENTDFNSATTSELNTKKYWKSGEVYRYGIVVKDVTGNTSPVKWVCDFKMPEKAVTASGASYVVNHYPIMYVNTATTEAYGYATQVVYQPLEDSYKRILSEGVVTTVIVEEDAIEQPYANPYFKPLKIEDLYKVQDKDGFSYASWGVDEGYFNNTHNAVARVFALASPELLLTKDFPYKNGLKVKVLHQLSTSTNSYIQEEGTDVPQFLHTPVSLLQHSNYNICDVQDVAILRQRSLTTISNGTTSFVVRSENDAAGGTNDANWISSTFLLFSIPESTPKLIPNVEANANFPYARIYRNITPYNGDTYADRLLATYVPASDSFIPPVPISCFRGDTVISMFEHHHTALRETNNWTRNMFFNITFPIESRFNMSYRYDNSFWKGGGRMLGNKLYPHLLEESNNPTGDLYKYDSAYSAIDKSVLFLPSPTDFQGEIVNDCKVIYSDKSTEDKYVNYWSMFKPNNYTWLDGSFGEGTKLQEFNNEVYFFQESGFGLLSINPRVTQVGEDGITTVLGTGEVLDRAQYVSTEVGTTKDSDIVKSLQALYWIDPNKRKLYRFAQQLETISDTKGMDAYFSNVLTRDSKLMGIYDNENAMVYFTIKNQNITYGKVVATETVEEPRVLIDFTNTSITTAIKPSAVIELDSVAVGSYIELTLDGTVCRFTCVASVVDRETEFVYDVSSSTVLSDLKAAVDAKLLELTLSTTYTTSIVSGALNVVSEQAGNRYDLNPTVYNPIVGLQGSSNSSGGSGATTVLATTTITNNDTWVIVDISTAGGVDRLDIKKNGVTVAQTGVYQASNYGIPNPEITLPKIISRDGTVLRELYRGVWNSLEPYRVGDIVKSGVKYYVSLVLNNLNQAVTTSNWKELVVGSLDNNVWNNGDDYWNEFATNPAFVGTNSVLIGGSESNLTGGIPPTRYADYLSDGGMPTYDWLGSEGSSVSGGIIKDGVVSHYNYTGYENAIGQRVWAKFNSGDTVSVHVMGAGDTTGWAASYFIVRPAVSNIAITETKSEELIQDTVVPTYTTVVGEYTYTNTYTGATITLQDNTKGILSLSAGIYKLSGLIDNFRIRKNVQYSIGGAIFTVNAVDYENRFVTLNLVEGTPTLGIVDTWEFLNYRTPFTIIYSEILQKFLSFERFVPQLYAKNFEGFYTTDSFGDLYKHGVGNSGEFYGKLYDSYIDVVVPTKQLTDFTTAYFYLWANEGSKQVPEKCLHSIKVYSDDQETDEVVLYPKSDERYVRDNESTRIPNNGVSIVDGTGFHPYSTLYNISKDASRRWSVGLPRPYDGERAFGSYSVVRFKFRNEGKMKQVLETLLINITK